MCSAVNPFRRATCSRCLRKEFRITTANHRMITASIGMMTNVISASRQLIQSSAAATPTIMKRSAMIVIAPCVSRSLSAAMSFVKRVTRRPTGLESKNAIDMRCRCRNNCIRMSFITFWDTTTMRSDWT